MKDHKGNISFALVLGVGLILILVFLTLLYLGQIEAPKLFGLFGQKKQQEQPTEAKVTPTTSSITLNETNPRLGNTVHFSYILPKGIKEDPIGSGTQARIQVICYQSGDLVYGEAMNAIDAKTKGILLGGGWSRWLEIGGPADCVATLYQFLYQGQQTFNQFATTSFTAAGK